MITRIVDSPPLILYVRRVRALPIIILDFFVDTVYVAAARSLRDWPGQVLDPPRTHFAQNIGPEQWARPKNEVREWRH